MSKTLCRSCKEMVKVIDNQCEHCGEWLGKDEPTMKSDCKKIVLTFYTGIKGEEVVLESKLLEKINQDKDIDEILIHVKMPSRDTKEFRNAVKQALSLQRTKLIEELEKMEISIKERINQCNTSNLTSFAEDGGEIMVGKIKALEDIRKLLKE